MGGFAQPQIAIEWRRACGCVDATATMGAVRMGPLVAQGDGYIAAVIYDPGLSCDHCGEAWERVTKVPEEVAKDPPRPTVTPLFEARNIEEAIYALAIDLTNAVTDEEFDEVWIRALDVGQRIRSKEYGNHPGHPVKRLSPKRAAP